MEPHAPQVSRDQQPRLRTQRIVRGLAAAPRRPSFSGRSTIAWREQHDQRNQADELHPDGGRESLARSLARPRHDAVASTAVSVPIGVWPGLFLRRHNDQRCIGRRPAATRSSCEGRTSSQQLDCLEMHQPVPAAEQKSATSAVQARQSTKRRRPIERMVTSVNQPEPTPKAAPGGAKHQSPSA